MHTQITYQNESCWGHSLSEVLGEDLQYHKMP